MNHKSMVARVGVGVPDDAKDVRGFIPVYVAAGEVGDHLGVNTQSKIENQKLQIP